MTGWWATLAKGCLGAAVVCAALAGVRGAGTASAFAVCDEPPDDAMDLISIISPAPGPNGFGGPPPLTFAIRIAEGLAIFQSGDLTSSFDWGDGGSSQVVALPCPNGEDSYWPTQTLSHTYQGVGTYQTTWSFAFSGQRFDLPFVTVVVADAPAATPTPPPAPTQAPTQAPTLPSGPTQAPAPTTPGPTVAGALTETPAAATPTAIAATATSTPTETRAATIVGAAAPVAGTPTASRPSRGTGAVTPVANEEYRSRTFLRLEAIDDVSREPDVIATNLIIAGVTVWVLFSSVLLNQVLQENRTELDRRTSWLTQPVRRLRRQPAAAAARRGLPGWARRLLIPALVLAMTGVIYSVLEPDFGWNEHTFVLFGSAVLGVGLVTYLCSGLEAIAARRWMSANAAVRPFPVCIAIAAASVAISRLLDLQPGVMYGFVASCAVAAPVAATSRQGGRVALAPVTAALAIAVGAWLLVGPIRGLNEDPGGWLPALLEATVIVVFIGGIEGTVLSMLPLAETDGGKIYRWNRWLWLAIAVTAAFLTWHVLFGRERSYFGGLREATSMTVFVMFAVYTALTVGVWAYFRSRKPPIADSVSGPSPAG